MTEKPDNSENELEGQHPPLAQPAGSAAATTEPGAQPGAGVAEHGLREGARQPDLAAGATRAPADATRSFETAHGRLNYAELAERLAAPLQGVDLGIRRGDYGVAPLDEMLLLSFHAALSQELFPELAGCFRQKPVQVGAHLPPDPTLVAQRMREYMLNLGARMAHLTGDADELLLELLAYAEGELLSIHPFPDLNGRVSRLWLTEILRRLDLPPVDVVPAGAAFRARYLAALSAADHRNWTPLMTLWKERLSQATGLNEIELPGCTPTPLASYLKALAVLRLVAEAGEPDGGDPEATGFWRDDVFVLRTKLTPAQLLDFCLERYRPTPLIAPWNGGSGFYANDNKEGIDSISASLTPRLEAYRNAITIAKVVVAKFALTESPKQEDKDAFLKLLRNWASDALLRWMDAAIVLSEDGARYPPLLGTGGNDGRLDFTNNFMQRLADVVDMQSGSAQPGADSDLKGALFGSPTDRLLQSPIGQFSPGAAGGPNAGSGFDGNARINAWDFVLMLEGAVLFAASAARRLESADPAILVAPFTVRSRVGTVGGSDASDDAHARGEAWMPLWTAPCNLHELRGLLAEGRAAINGRPSRDGLDFARAVAQLGVDRGIDSFQRFGFLMRSGKAFLATPLDRVAVRRNPDADLISDLEHRQWLATVQRHSRDENAPNAFRSGAKQLDAALFALAQRSSREAFQATLRHIGRVESALHRSPKSLDAVRAPAPQLSAAWATKADDGSAEFQIARALAGLRFHNANGSAELHARRHLVPVGEAVNRQGDRPWEPSSRLATWGNGSLTKNLSLLLHRRLMEAVARGVEGDVLGSDTGATRQDLAGFLDGRTDDRRIADLLAGLVCVDLRHADRPTGPSNAVLPPAFAILKVLFTPESVLHALRWLPEDRRLRLPSELPALLAANDVQAGLRLAWQRLRAVGIRLPGRDSPQVVGVDGPRWLAALCIPLTRAETARLLSELKLEPETEHRSPQETAAHRSWPCP